jgi:hypothetical protein
LIWSGTLEGTAADLDLLRSIKQPYSVDGGVETGYGYVTYNNGQITSESDGGANLQGTLHVTGFYYGDVLEEVEAAFPNLTIVCDESPYIRFEDDEVERICSENWGNYHEIITVDNGDDTVTVTTNFVRMNNTTVASRTQESVVTRAKTEDDVAGTVKEKDGITYAQAAAVSSLGTAFRNSSIVKFNELNFFTSITRISGDFYTCSQLQEIGLDNINDGRGDTAITLFGSEQITYAYLPNWVRFIGNRARLFKLLTGGLRIGKNCTSITNLVQSGNTPYFIIESELVVERTGSYSNAMNFFVPDAYVEAYKESSQWSSVAEKIHPLSEFRIIFPNEPERMYVPW